MGIDLDLLPVDADFPNCSFSHSVLQCERRHNLWPAIQALPGQPVPDNFTSYLGGKGEACYGKTVEDSYGDPVRWVRVRDLLTLRCREEVRDNSKNRAVWAYLAELPPEGKVALFWH